MYKITISKIESETKKEKSWEKLRDTYPDETSNTGRERDKQYGYVETEMTSQVEKVILVQEVEEMDLTSVIKAINKIQ